MIAGDGPLRGHYVRRGEQQRFKIRVSVQLPGEVLRAEEPLDELLHGSKGLGREPELSVAGHALQSMGTLAPGAPPRSCFVNRNTLQAIFSGLKLAVLALRKAFDKARNIRHQWFRERSAPIEVRTFISCLILSSVLKGQAHIWNEFVLPSVDT